jgi:hypothetical protein
VTRPEFVVIVNRVTREIIVEKKLHCGCRNRPEFG